MARCVRCGRKGLFLRVNKEGLCKKCEKSKGEGIIDPTKLKGKGNPSYAENLGNNKKYFVYDWRIKKTGEIFYVGKSRGNKDNFYAFYDEWAYEANRIIDTYDTEIVIVRDNLSEEEATISEMREKAWILNKTTYRLTNRVIPFSTKRDNGYGPANDTPKLEFEKASVLYANEIENHFFGVKARAFDNVFQEALKKPFISDKLLSENEFKIVYADHFNKYIKETRALLRMDGAKILKTKYAKSVTCWIYPTGCDVSNFEMDEKKAIERIGRRVPCFHLIDVWKFLRDKHGKINIPKLNIKELKPKFNRIPLQKIENSNDWDRGFTSGFSYWEKGEKERKAGNLQKALKLYDKARENGYNAPALYNSYAKLFRKVKAYDDEILILKEGQKRVNAYGSSKKKVYADWEERIERAYELRNKTN